MHCQVPGIDYSLSKLAIHAALESATAIALSHTSILYIAETDEKKINRVRQVCGCLVVSLFKVWVVFFIYLFVHLFIFR